MRQVVAVLILGICTCEGAVGQTSTRSPSVDFSHDIVPILRRHCVECHGGTESRGGFSINTREDWLESGYVDPEDAEGSRVWELITSLDEEDQMPPAGKARVPERERQLLLIWMRNGLPWEAGFSFGQRTYRPPLLPRRVEVPQSEMENPIDAIVGRYFEKHGIEWPAEVSDAQFLRRVSLDLIGLLPDEELVEAFLQDSNPDKRSLLVDQLLADDLAYTEHWLTFFNDLLRNDYSGTGFITGGREQITRWLYAALFANKPFDQFARELIAPPTPESRGFIRGIQWRGNATVAQSLEMQFAQNVSQVFLGINLKCASCHDSFIDRWTLNDAYGMAAIYAERPLELHRCDQPLGKLAKPGWLFPEIGDITPNANRDTRLGELAALMTSRKNGRFSRTIVNRLWHRMMGRGIVHPVDAMQTEPWSADLLDFLATYLVDQNYDLKKVLALIAKSRIYQARCIPLQADHPVGEFRGPLSRRMTAEQFLDCVWQITGTAPLQYDAPVIRGIAQELPDDHERVTAAWIWGAGDTGARPPGEELVFRAKLKLRGKPRAAWGVITCDNAFELYVNRRRVAAGDDWGQPVGLLLTQALNRTDNEIVVVARNAGTAPNPAGLIMEARIEYEQGPLEHFVTDSTWQYADGRVSIAEGRLGNLPEQWATVQELEPLPVWTEAFVPQAERLLTAGRVSGSRMIRASLLKNNALMRTLGRPLRDQVVSMRPSQFTTLEAVQLANDEGFMDILQRGATNLLESRGSDTIHMAKYLFARAFLRPVSREEQQEILDAFGSTLDAKETQDLLWAVFMQPEFLFVR